jgi:lipid II:glycine glycyltransferase (peptidoglycan interpeptide bridge formation enzyme)
MISTQPIDNQKEWEAFLMDHPESNFLQSWYWGEFHKKLGHSLQRTGFYEGNKLIGIMLSIVEPARRARYLTVPAGPIIDWHNKLLVKEFVKTIQKLGKDQNCVFVRVRPQLIKDEFSRNLFKQLKFKSAPMHLHAELTSQLDITKREDDLMAHFRQNTRYEIRKAAKLNIAIKTSTDPADIKSFYDLQIETAKRHNFVPFSYEYLHEQFKVFASRGKAVLYSAYLKDQLLAQAFIIFYGVEAAYHYGASTEAGRKLPGAYLIQWEAVKEAKKRGLQRYNFWGVVPEDAKNHRFYGVSVFKRGFRGADVEYIHAQDLVINQPRYLFNLAIEEVRKKTRHL